MPALIDGMDDAVNKAYQALPDRLYLVGKNGEIAYAGDRGPFGFKPDELETCLLYTSPSPRDRTRSRMPSSA